MPDPDRRFKRVRGTFEGTVGLRDDPASPTRDIRGAFATSMIDTNVR